MSLKQCPNCKRDIASTSDRCGYCGYQINPIIIDEEEENRARYLLIGSRIFLILLALIIVVVLIENFRQCSRNATNKEELIIPKEEVVPLETESAKTNSPYADELLNKAKIYYNEGNYNKADVVLTQIINDYKNSNTVVEASKLRVTVIKAIQDKWKTDQKKRDLQNHVEERNKKQELQRIYYDDPIKYYKSIYGKPDSESDFTTGSYVSKTLIWFCVAEKYRSISFVYKDGSWRKESEYTSDCN